MIFQGFYRKVARAEPSKIKSIGTHEISVAKESSSPDVMSILVHQLNTVSLSEDKIEIEATQRTNMFII